MLSSRFAPWHVPVFAAKYAWLTVRRRPLLVHFEVTMRCNARCSFCDYWKTPPDARMRETERFAAAARYFRPVMITFTGGEPLLRHDLEDIVAAVHRASRFTYLALITHGGMLTAERGEMLWRAGLSQFNISLDYLDGRHDQARGIPGLTRKLLGTVAAMRERGIDAIRFNTVIKSDNLDQLLPIARLAAELGCGVNYSLYTDFKNGNTAYVLEPHRTAEVEAVIGELLAFKRRQRRTVTNSEWYLRQIVRFVRGERPPKCRSGIRTIHVDPSGFVRRCPDFPSDFHWSAFRPYSAIECSRCWYACRGEAEAPLTLSRFRDVLA
jgi:MoaA/NifB/PqqE/SkfB family radical SAM enzyme